jgi:hypothetical protein
MRPNVITRVTDRVFERCDTLVEATDRIEARLTGHETSRVRRMLFGYFAALAGGLILRSAQLLIEGPTAGVPGVPAIAIASLVGALALYRGRRKHPGEQPRRILLGWVLLLAIFVVVWFLTAGMRDRPVLLIGG